MTNAVNLASLAVSGALSADANGNVGIGTTSPLSTFEINRNTTSGTSTAYPNIRLDNQSATGYTGYYFYQAGTQKAFFELKNDVGALTMGTGITERARITSGGDFLMGTTTKLIGGVDGLDINTTADTGITFAQNGTVKNWFYLNGSNWQWQTVSGVAVNVVSNTNGVTLANGGTSWGSLSDERLKDILEPIDNAVSKVSSLRTVIGKYKTEEEGIRRSMLIAQDVREVLPEAVIENNDGNLILQYTDTIPLLVAAIKELKAELDATKARLATLEGAA